MKRIFMALLPSLFLFASCIQESELIPDQNSGSESSRQETEENPSSEGEETYAPVSCDAINADLTALQIFVQALENGEYASSFAEASDKSAVYTVEMTGAGAVHFYSSYEMDYVPPRIGIVPVEGHYCWTLDNALLTGGGESGLRVSDAAATPSLKVEKDRWLLSADGGATWTEIAEIEEGTAETVVSGLDSDDKNVFLSLSTGTILTVSRLGELSLLFDETDDIVCDAGGTVRLSYRLSGAQAKATVSASGSNGWTAKVSATGDNAGYVTVTAPDPIVNGTVVVSAENDLGQKDEKTLSFAESKLELIADNSTVSAEGGTVTITVKTNTGYTVEIPSEAQSWISRVTTKAAVRTEQIALAVAKNTALSDREATLNIRKSSGETILQYRIVQAHNILYADAYLTLSADMFSESSSAGAETLTLSANRSWSAAASASWISVSPSAGAASEENQTLRISVTANSGAARTGTVTVTAESISKTITISQEAGTSAREDDDDDNVANTAFAETVTITYGSGGASVSDAAFKSSYMTVSGNDVTVNYTGSSAIKYVLKGTATDGFFKLYSSKKQAIELSGVSLANPSGAAINNQSHKRTFVIVTGTNTLKDGSIYSDAVSSEDMKAAFFSEGQLIFSGSGTLTVTAAGKAGITSDDYIRFMSSPTIKVSSSAGHCIRGKEAIIVSDGTIEATATAAMKKAFHSDSLVQFDGGVTTLKVTGSAAYDSDDKEYTGTAGIKAGQLFVMNAGDLTITNSGKGGKGISGDAKGYFNGGAVTITTTGAETNGVSSKGIKFDGNLYFAGGNTIVKTSYSEGIESKGSIDITGGTVCSSSYDDAINSKSHLTISGGYVYAQASNNDGLDANGNLYIKGGVVMAAGARSPELAIDANTEGGYKLYISEGTVIALGGIESGASLSQAIVKSASWSKNTSYALYSGSTLLCAFKAPSSGTGSGMVLSHSALKSGSSYTLKSGVTLSGGTSYLNGAYIQNATVTGGTSSSLTATASSGNSGGGGGRR